MQVSDKHFLNGFGWEIPSCDAPSRKDGCSTGSLDIDMYANCQRIHTNTVSKSDASPLHVYVPKSVNTITAKKSPFIIYIADTNEESLFTFAGAKDRREYFCTDARRLIGAYCDGLCIS